MEEKTEVEELCTEGMKAESENRMDDARNLYLKAWEVVRNEYDAANAAHFLARSETNPKESLKWDLESLRYADLADTEKLRTSYPSFLVNAGISYEELGDFPNAKRYYDLAMEKIEDLPEDEYGREVKESVVEAMERSSKFK